MPREPLAFHRFPLGFPGDFFGPSLGSSSDGGFQLVMGVPQLVGGLEHILFSHILGIIIPIDFHIFQRGGPTTNQPSSLDGLVQGKLTMNIFG